MAKGSLVVEKEHRCKICKNSRQAEDIPIPDAKECDACDKFFGVKNLRK